MRIAELASLAQPLADRPKSVPIATALERILALRRLMRADENQLILEFVEAK
jgi:hypothetical protein